MLFHFFLGIFLARRTLPWQNIWSQITGGIGDQKHCFLNESTYTSLRAIEISCSCYVSCYIPKWFVKIARHFCRLPFLGCAPTLGWKTATTCKLHPGSLHHEIPGFGKPQTCRLQIWSKNHPKVINVNPLRHRGKVISRDNPAWFLAPLSTNDETTIKDKDNGILGPGLERGRS